MTSIDDVIKGITTSGVDRVRGKLGALWDSFSDQEKQDVADLLQTVAEVRLLELAGKDVSRRLGILDAAILQYEAAASVVAASAVRVVVQEVAGALGALVGTAIRVGVGRA